MVLSPPAAHDAPGPPEAGWIARVKLGLRLSRAGILILVDRARPERIGELVRALLPEHPDLEVHTDVREVYEAPEGGVMVLAPKVSDADWLNLQRPVFARRALKVVLWCDRETTEALARGAVDFYDWISQYNECPPGLPQHAIRGIRCALAARAPGILWKGTQDREELGRLLEAALPRRSFRWISPQIDYGALVAAIQQAGPAWVVFPIQSTFHVQRIRWALAEARRTCRAILIAPETESPGWWPVHDRLMPLHEARQLLARTGVRSPGRLAAAAALEPEAIDIAGTLLAHSDNGESLLGAMLAETDPGAAIASYALKAGLVSIESVVTTDAPPPVLRVAGRDPQARALQRLRVDNLAARMASGEDISARDAGWCAALNHRSTSSATVVRSSTARPFAIEQHLRSRIETPRNWISLAAAAFMSGDSSATAWWARRSIIEHGESDVSLSLLGSALLTEGMWRDSETAFRRALIRTPTSFPAMQPARNWILSGLAASLVAQGSYRDAEEILQEVHDDDDTTENSLNPSLQVLRGNVSLIMSRYADAEHWLRLAVEHDGPLSGIHRLAAQSHLAETLAQQGRRTQALNVLFQSLSQAEPDPEVQQHPVHAEALCRLADLFADEGKAAEALHWIDRGMASAGQQRGINHPSFVERIPSLANGLNHLGRFKEAEALLRKTLWLAGNLWVSSVGELPQIDASFDLLEGGAPLVSSSLLREFLMQNNVHITISATSRISAVRYLVDALTAQGRHAEAVPLLNAVLALEEATNGPMHPSLCPLLARLARLLVATDQGPAAEEYFQRAVAISSSSLGPDHPRTEELRDALTQLATGNS